MGTRPMPCAQRAAPVCLSLATHAWIVYIVANRAPGLLPFLPLWTNERLHYNLTWSISFLSHSRNCCCTSSPRPSKYWILYRKLMPSQVGTVVFIVETYQLHVWGLATHPAHACVATQPCFIIYRLSPNYQRDLVVTDFKDLGEGDPRAWGSELPCTQEDNMASDDHSPPNRPMVLAICWRSP